MAASAAVTIAFRLFSSATPAPWRPASNPLVIPFSMALFTRSFAFSWMDFGKNDVIFLATESIASSSEVPVLPGAFGSGFHIQEGNDPSGSLGTYGGMTG